KEEGVGTAPAPPAADREPAVAREQTVVRTRRHYERRQGDRHAPEPFAHIETPLLGPHMIIKRSVRRKSPGDSLVHLTGHVGGEIPYAARDRGSPTRRAPAWLQPAIMVGEPGCDGFEHPRLHLDRCLCGHDTTH